MVLPAGFAPETEEHKHVEPARLSVVLPNLRVSGDPAVMGPMFVAAGLQIGDEIITIEGRPILDVKEAVEKLFNFEGECCELYVYRPGTDDSFTATLMRDSKE
jgi:C-terminal processing protease CtpA/Prc